LRCALLTASTCSLEILMSKKPVSDDDGNANETTEQALIVLTAQIKDLVQHGSLDSRLAAKLLKRLKKEALIVAAGDKTTKTGQKDLSKAFDAADTALRDHEAALLVTANAALRETDNKRSGKKSLQATKES
jgi:hypothetical protein